MPSSLLGSSVVAVQRSGLERGGVGEQKETGETKQRMLIQALLTLLIADGVGLTWSGVVALKQQLGGGRGLRIEQQQPAARAYVRRHAQQERRPSSICPVTNAAHTPSASVEHTSSFGV